MLRKNSIYEAFSLWLLCGKAKDHPSTRVCRLLSDLTQHNLANRETRRDEDPMCIALEGISMLSESFRHGVTS